MAGEPMKFTRSKEEAVQAVQDWMRRNYRDQLSANPDWYHTRLGFLIDCISDLHTPTFTAVPQGDHAA